MDFVTAWKATSVVMTGAFGILGLLKEFKNKETGQVTKWGRISLAGILLSSGLGVVAQLKESSDQETSRKNDAIRSLALAEKTDQTVRDVQRTLSSLQEPAITLSLLVNCQDPAFKKVCSVSNCDDRYIDRKLWKEWPEGPKVTIDLKFQFFRNPDDFESSPNLPPNTPDLSLLVSAKNYREDAKAPVLGISCLERHSVNLEIWEVSARMEESSSGKISSMLDFPGALVVVSLPIDVPRLGLVPYNLKIRNKNGQEIAVKEFNAIDSMRYTGLIANPSATHY
jgi:hypothetical protein